MAIELYEVWRVDIRGNLFYFCTLASREARMALRHELGEYRPKIVHRVFIKNRDEASIKKTIEEIRDRDIKLDPAYKVLTNKDKGKK